MRAFLLAAGRGERVRPLSDLLPKPLFPFGNVPLIYHPLSLLRSFGVEEAVVNLHHLGDKVRATLGTEACGVRLRYSEEPESLGTAGGIKKAEAELKGGTFFVANADVASEAPLEKATEAHRRGGFLATLLVRRDPESVHRPGGGPLRGLLEMDEGGRLQTFPGGRAPGRVAGALRPVMFTGLTVMEPEFLSRIPPGRYCDIAEEVYPALLTAGAPLGAFDIGEAYWCDLGAPERYLEAHWDLLQGRYRPPEGTLPGPPDTPAQEGGAALPPLLLSPGVQLAAGARVGPLVCLGEGCRLGKGSEVRESVLWEGVEVGEGASLHRCIAAAGTRVPAHLHLERRLLLPEAGDGLRACTYAGEPG